MYIHTYFSMYKVLDHSLRPNNSEESWCRRRVGVGMTLHCGPRDPTCVMLCCRTHPEQQRNLFKGVVFNSEKTQTTLYGSDGSRLGGWTILNGPAQKTARFHV